MNSAFDVVLHEVGVDGDRRGRASACRGDHLSAGIDDIPRSPHAGGAGPAGRINLGEAGRVEFAAQPSQQTVGVREIARPDEHRCACNALVHHLRSDVLPASVTGTDATARLTGQAMIIDLTERITNRLPLFIAAIVAMSFLLLMLVFRSILVPLKAALMNLLSIAAAYGVIVAVFQWGWGNELIGVHHTMPINPFAPLMMFAILFGLSMDYEVFLLARIREEYVATGDSHQSVVTGLSGTARVITSAALIMISVFGSFVLGDDPTGKLFGVGLAAAVFLDATLVRMVLVPATMSLLGRANWWLPTWMERILPHIDFESAPMDAEAIETEDERELVAA